MKRFWQKSLVLILILALLSTSSPALAAALEPSASTLSLTNGYIEVIASTQNGGFLIRTIEGDVITKDDNNKDLLYRNDRFDTCFTSFQVTTGGVTKEYIFGNNYSFLGLGHNLQVTKQDSGIKAVWSVDNLVFTQLLEPVYSESSNEHGTVKISYSVVNKQGREVAVKARLLLDTALGNQDYAYYELAKSNTSGGGYERVEQEKLLTADIPANFFAYDDYENPTIAAYTINDQSDGAPRPYQIAFGHWNNLAATVFDFAPDSGMTFTNPYNKSYLTADSAFALYFDLQNVAPGGQSKTASTYYGVDSKVRVKDSDRVGISVTAPLTLSLNAGKNAYLDPADSSQANGEFDITTNITNLAKPGAVALENIAIAVLLDDGLTPFDSGGNLLDQVSNKYPYRVELSDLDVNSVKQLVWRLKADVAAETTYRKIVFRAYDVSRRQDDLLVLDDLIGSSTVYVLCPGGSGVMPQVTFTGAEPGILYNQGTRHFYVTGKGFSFLADTSRYVLRAYLRADNNVSFIIPSQNIVQTQPGTLDIILTETMPVGEYELVFEWQTPLEGIPKVLTAPALRFLVTSDPSYRNDYYGIVAVVKEETTPGNFRYVIKTFANEDGFKAFAGNVLLVFRGNFSVTDKVGDEIVACSAISSTKTDNITINGALDLCDGNIQIYRGPEPGNLKYLMVELNGNLYTSHSRTAVWSGHSVITPLEDGLDYGLIAYDQNGERIEGEQPGNLISLVWPNDLGMLQTLAGMAVDLRYGEFGAMYTDENMKTFEGYVISFGGKLDLSFLMPGGAKQGEELEKKDKEGFSFAELKRKLKATGKELYEAIKNYQPTEAAKAAAQDEKVKPVGRLTVQDILFGKDQGYIGFNTSAELTLPKYIEALPSMSGRLDINTINGYAVGVAGKVEAVVFEMEFELKVRSAPNSGIPIPDKLYLYIADFEPGVNVDGLGAFWLTGGGGGIDNVYDSIFGKGGVPPLKLLLSASFDIMKVMSGRADLSLGLRGFGLKLSDIKLKKTEVVVIQGGQLSFAWVPDLNLVIAAQVDLYNIVEGGAYLVVDGSFFELFLRTTVKVPEVIPIFGGIAVGGVDLGGNSEKIWGVANALGLKLGITYYWGGDNVKFGIGGETSAPTYPDLLASSGASGGRNLYMHVGSNVSLSANSVLSNDLQSYELSAVSPSLSSDLDRLNHRLNLGSDTGSDAVLTICFTGDSRPLTVADAQAAVAFLKPDNSPYTLNFYDGTNVTTANANFVLDETAQTSTIAVTITDYVAGNWSIRTVQPANIVLYDVAPLPEVKTLTASHTGAGPLQLTWSGQKLDETKVSIYVTPDIGVEGTSDAGELGVLIGRLNNPEAAGQTMSFDLPADLQTGDYYVRLIASKQDSVNQTMVATTASGAAYTFKHINRDQPAPPSAVSLENSGDERFKVQVVPGSDSSPYDGYCVSIFENTSGGLVPTDFTGLFFQKDAQGNMPEMIVGGTYFTTDGHAYGLTAGKSYVAQVAAYKLKDSGTSGEADLVILSTDVMSAATQLLPATPPKVTFRPQSSYKMLSRMVQTGVGTQEQVQVPTFTSGEVRFTLQTDVPVSGYWTIDGLLAQDPTDPTSTGLTVVDNVSSVSITQQLCDGDHVVSFVGTDEQGDSFCFSKLFAVDTTPPRLMLTSPNNGSFFEEDGTLWIEGLGDKDALYTVVVDGVTLIKSRTLASLGVTPDPDNGVFRLRVAVEPGVSSHRVLVIAEDAVGNSAVHQATVQNQGLGKIESVNVLTGGAFLPNKNIPLAGPGNTSALLQLVGTTGNGRQMLINDSNLVQWTAVAKRGNAEVEADGQLTIAPNSIGFVEGALRISDTFNLTDALAFGAEVNLVGLRHLVVASTMGGTATGEGAYLPGAEVKLTATPTPGYRFVKWVTSGGGSFANASAATTSFTMPDQNVVVTAQFKYISSGVIDPPEQPDPDIPEKPDPEQPDPEKPIPPEPDPEQPENPEENLFNAGTFASIALPEQMATNPQGLVVCYMVGQREVIVPLSAVLGGKMVFLAPATATYYLKRAQPNLRDIDKHWARGVIHFVASRGLLRETGNQLFSPQIPMTRAMFVTVLARLDSADLSAYKRSQFTDVPDGSWYSQAVAWAVDVGVTHGVGGGLFGPDQLVTREQLATLICNYLAYKGYKLPVKVANPPPFADQSSISKWALKSMDLMHRSGLIVGKSGTFADPQGAATRAECAAIFQRLIVALLTR